MSDLTYPDDDDFSDDWFPSDFMPDDIDDDDVETLHDIQRMIGLPITGMISTYDDEIEQGRGGQMRAVRFSSGAEALLWLFRRGIYLYSSLVKFSDGSWGVSIGSSDKGSDNDAGSEPDNSIPF